MKIIAYASEHKSDFKRLNVEWLKKYFFVEPIDELVLSNPEDQIISKGGFIFFALENDEVVGTVALLKESEKVFEIGKMAVTSNQQGKGIGRKLMQHCLQVAKKKNIEVLELYSHEKLLFAMSLYTSLGFEEVPLDDNHYQRAGNKMKLCL